MYEERIYGHFLEKKITEVHQEIRKKVLRRNSKKKTINFTISMKKLPQDIELKEIINHTRKLSIPCCNPHQKKDTKMQKLVNQQIQRISS